MESLQTLWGGYGDLQRIHLNGGATASVILKQIVFPKLSEESTSDRRKRRSYEVERAWYQEVAPHCPSQSRIAKLLGIEVRNSEVWILLEDLVASGFTPRHHFTEVEVSSGLRWLAHFHAAFLGTAWPQLWEQGTYWHLNTRPDEFRRMPEGELKSLAFEFDARLKRARFQTLVHGDAKTTNFCWEERGRAAAVDFQYVGGGCGIRDVALFLDRAVGRGRLRTELDSWLDCYFGHFGASAELESEWRSLFPVAWSDYARFRQGWGPAGELDPFSLTQLKKAKET